MLRYNEKFDKEKLSIRDLMKNSLLKTSEVKIQNYKF